MIHDHFDVYLGESIRASNGSQPGLPIFGKFAAIIRHDSYRLIENDGAWYIGKPWGSSLVVGNCEEEETREQWEVICKAFAGGAIVDGWTTNSEAAKAAAIQDASNRHEQKIQDSAAYAAKFGA